MLTRLTTRSPALGGAAPEFVAFLDYAYMPYALGDALTYIQNAQVMAREAGANSIDLFVLASRERPSPSWQPFITAHNYVSNVHGLLPALLSSPMLHDIHLLENRQIFYAMISSFHQAGVPMWPRGEALTKETIDFMSHMKVVDHFRRTGSIPLLAAPPGYAVQTAAFVADLCPDKFRVVVNIRQSHLKFARAQPERDSSFGTWAEFIARCSERYRDIAFIVSGQYSDVDRRFERLPATLVPRSWGYGLGVELTLLQEADMFMGTSSGFSQAALFGHPAYVVTNTEPRAAAFCGVPAGARHHPFGRPDQIVTWTLETPDSLMDDFEEVLAFKHRNGQRVPAAHAVAI